MTISKAELQTCVQRFLAYGADVRNFSPRTIESYRADLDRFCEWIRRQDEDPLSFDHRLIGGYVSYQIRQRRLKPRSVNRSLSTLRSVINYLIVSEDRRELQKTLLSIKSIRAAHPLPAPLSVEQIDRLIPEAVDFTTARDAALIELLYSTGCRISELLSIDVDQVVRSQDSIVITGKGGKQREVYIGARAQQAVTRYLPFRHTMIDGMGGGNTDSGGSAMKALLINRRGRRLTRQGANVALAKYRHILPLNNPLSAHVFRHSFATHILDSGADIRAVQELLGHARLSSTQVYTHVSRARMQRVYRQAHPHGRRIGSASAPNTEHADE